MNPVRYIRTLEAQSFEGWSEESKNGYLTALKTMEDFLLQQTRKSGWVKIKTEADLPKGDGNSVYWTLRKNFTVPMYKFQPFFDEEAKKYWLETYEYYKLIKTPLPPRIIP